MFHDDDLAGDLKARFDARAAVLYGSAATGNLRPDSDIDVVCFTASTDQHPIAYIWQGFLIDAWIHPLADAARAEQFIKLHDARVLFDDAGVCHALVAAVAERLRQPRSRMDARVEQHRRAWLWKMLDRAARSSAESDHRRHWLLTDLAENWCEFTGRHYLGARRALDQMRSEADDVYAVVERALKPDASLENIEQAVSAIAGPRPAMNSSG
jgi:hypothetical protein